MPTAPAKPLVYLETSFISYLTARVSSDPKLALDQAATRRWWEGDAPKCDLFVSEIVLDEAKNGDPVQSALRTKVLRDLRSVPSTSEAFRLSARLLAVHALPENSSTDALHVALAVVYGADILLTWNCRHIANPTTLPLTMKTIAESGYRCPANARKLCAMPMARPSSPTPE